MPQSRTGQKWLKINPEVMEVAIKDVTRSKKRSTTFILMEMNASHGTIPIWKLTLHMVQYPLSHGIDLGMYRRMKKVSWENLNFEAPMGLEKFIFTLFFSQGPLYLMSLRAKL